MTKSDANHATSNSGRPRVLDAYKQHQISIMIQNGCSIQQTARALGCAPSTIRREAQRNDNFQRLLDVAKVTANATPLEWLRTAARREWRAAAWLLERTQPELYGKPTVKRIKIEHLDEVVTALLDAVVEESDDDALCERIFSRVGDVAHHIASGIKSDSRPRRIPPFTCDDAGVGEFCVERWRADLQAEARDEQPTSDRKESTAAPLKSNGRIVNGAKTAATREHDSRSAEQANDEAAREERVEVVKRREVKAKDAGKKTDEMRDPVQKAAHKNSVHARRADPHPGVNGDQCPTRLAPEHAPHGDGVLRGTRAKLPAACEAETQSDPAKTALFAPDPAGVFRSFAPQQPEVQMTHGTE